MYTLKYHLIGNEWQQEEDFISLASLIAQVSMMLKQGKIETIEQLDSVSICGCGDSVQALITVLECIALYGCNSLKGQVAARVDYLRSN